MTQIMNTKILGEIKQKRKANFIETNLLRLHKGIAILFKFTATNKYAHTISDALNSVRNVLYNKIRKNRKNVSQKISIDVKEKLSKNLGKNNAQREYSYFVDNNKQEINKYHKSNNLTLYPNSDIETFIDKFEDQVIQNRFDNMAANEGSSNHISLYFDTVYLKFLQIKLTRNKELY